MGSLMLECTICGLLSLNSRSCPACGSQNLVDLTENEEDPSMPSEVPGLDDAVHSLNELEGVNQNDEMQQTTIHNNPKSSKKSTLPFGYSGQSNVLLSRLPFGIGSQAEGVPFESENSSNLSDSTISQALEIEEGNAGSNEDSTDDDEGSHKVFVEETKPMKMVRVEPIKLDVQKSTSMIDDDPIKEEFFSVPDEWKIDAQDPDLEAIYSSEEKVVEVVHSSDDDVVIYDHEESKSHVQKKLTYHNPIEKSLLSLELHPAKAMNVNVGSDSELSLELEKGYFAIANNSWADAAISFQKLASRMPGDSAVFNNYGLSLLQRAIQMAKDKDESVQMMATSQFESAILALREAAKTAPDETVILLNLSHALLVSGRSEKALKIIQVHNQNNPSSLEGINLEAAALVSLGQSVSAKNRLSMIEGDLIIEENLSRLL